MDAYDVFAGLLSALLMAIAGILSLSATRNHGPTLGLQRRLWLAAFAVRFATSLLLYCTGLGVKIVGEGDDSGWVGGVALKDAWEADGLGPFQWPVVLLEAYQGHHRGYFYLLGVYFSATRMPSQLSAAALSCFCGAWVAVLTYRTARLLYSERVATRAGWWTCFFPLMIIWSAQSIKEPVVILLEAVALYACLAVRAHGFTTRHVLMATLAVAALPPFRFYAAYITGASILLTLTLPRLRRRRSGVIGALVVGVLVLPALSRTGLLSHHETEFEQWRDLDRVNSFRNAVATGDGSGSGVKSEYDMHTSQGLGLATLDGALHLLLAPYPWELRGASLRMILTLPEILVWWVLVFRGLLPGLRHALRRRLGDVLPLMLFLGGLGVVYSLTFGNVGIIYRQRAQLLPYLLIFAASGLELRALRRSRGAPEPDAVHEGPEPLPLLFWRPDPGPLDRGGGP